MLLAVTYAYFFQGGDPNQATRILLTKAIVDRGEPHITAYHAVRKAIPLLPPGTTCVVLGSGGLGLRGDHARAGAVARPFEVIPSSHDPTAAGGTRTAIRMSQSDGPGRSPPELSW